MAKYTVKQLEERVSLLRKQIETHGKNHPDYKKWQTSSNYYVGKLAYMDDNDLITIEF